MSQTKLYRVSDCFIQIFIWSFNFDCKNQALWIIQLYQKLNASQFKETGGQMIWITF